MIINGYLEDISEIKSKYAYSSTLGRSTSPIKNVFGYNENYAIPIESNHIITSNFYNQVEKPTFIPYEESFVLKIENCSFIDSSKLIILHDSNKILKHYSIDSIYATENEWKVDNLPINSEIKLEGTVLLLNCAWSAEYYHFHFNTLGKYATFLKHNLFLDHIDYIAIPQPNSFIEDWLKIFNFPLSKLIYLPGKNGEYWGHHIFANQLIIPSSPVIANLETVSLLRNSVLSSFPKVKPTKKLYISRQGSSSNRGRSIINELEIFHKILQPNGFDFIVPESLSILEKAEIFYSASHVVMPLGSGITNCMFMQPGSAVLDIFNFNHMAGLTNSSLAYLLGIKYFTFGVHEELVDNSSYSLAYNTFLAAIKKFMDY